MCEKMIDAHIHLDHYREDEIPGFLTEEVEALISVSMNLESCKRNLILSEKYSKIKPSFGFHPEQPLPSERDIDLIIDWINTNQEKMVAIGEVGLPYFLRAEGQVSEFQYEQYIEVLEQFLKLAKKWQKPVVLHAIYTDAPVVCSLLEKHSITRAHFHWFKGDSLTIQRMIKNGYSISVTPEIATDDQETLSLVRTYPVEKIMVETDGPWPFEGPFAGQRTNPHMMKESLKKIAEIKELPLALIYHMIRENTKNFYSLK
jgi:TatD DNase family protein